MNEAEGVLGWCALMAFFDRSCTKRRRRFLSLRLGEHGESSAEDDDDEEELDESGEVAAVAARFRFMKVFLEVGERAEPGRALMGTEARGRDEIWRESFGRWRRERGVDMARGEAAGKARSMMVVVKYCGLPGVGG